MIWDLVNLITLNSAVVRINTIILEVILKSIHLEGFVLTVKSNNKRLDVILISKLHDVKDWMLHLN
jgi:hypothetical protein